MEYSVEVTVPATTKLKFEFSGVICQYTTRSKNYDVPEMLPSTGKHIYTHKLLLIL